MPAKDSWRQGAITCPEVVTMKTGFGWIEIGGNRYEHDVVIHTDGRVLKRKKKPSKKYRQEYGHTPLSEDELGFLDDEQPDIVYAGLGQDGALPVTPRAGSLIAQFHGIMKPTPEILPLLEEEKRKFVAVLHVTC